MQTAWSRVLSSLQGATPSLVVIQCSAFPAPDTVAASSMSRTLVSIVSPLDATASPVPIVGASSLISNPKLSRPRLEFDRRVERG